MAASLASSLHLCRARLCWKHSSLWIVQQRSCNFSSSFTFNHRTLTYSQRVLSEEPSSQNQKKPPRETVEETRRQKFRKILTRFISGSRLLVQDVKKMAQIQRKLKQNNYDWNILTTEEILLLNQTRKDLIKTLPAVVVFCTIPVIGYAAPVLAYLYPKHLLSRHYWEPHQEEKFTASDAHKRGQYYLSLVREVGRSALDKKSDQKEELLHVCGKAINKGHPTNDELLKSLEFFSSNSLSLDQLPKYHLKKLSRALLVSLPWLPGFVLRARIRRHLNNIKKEDAAMKRDGVCQLNENELKKVCHSRGLDTTEIDTEGLVEWLTEWIELSDAASGKDESFLAHSTVFKSINYSRLSSEQGLQN